MHKNQTLNEYPRQQLITRHNNVTGYTRSFLNARMTN